VTDVSGVVGNYDGYVDFEDLMVLSDCFATSEGGAGWEAEFDIGPTDDFSRMGIPLPDDRVDFEDLMIFAMNFWHTGPVVAMGEESSGEPVLSLRASTSVLDVPVVSVGEEVEVKVILENGAGLVKGMRVSVSFEQEKLELLSVGRGQLLESSEMSVFFHSESGEGSVELCAVVLGTGVTLDESGEVVVLRFRVMREGMAEVRCVDTEVRDEENRSLELTVRNASIRGYRGVMPGVCRLHQNYPNPFRSGTEVRYEISQESRVTIEIYDAAGKLVQTLVDGLKEPGYYTVYWNRQSKMSRSAPAGIYFCRMIVEGKEKTSVTKKMISLR
jgi:hypothetical protein